MMKKIKQTGVAVLMILFAVIPFLVIYEPLSQAIPALPKYEAPGWFIPAGFISIALIVALSFLLASLSSNGDSGKY
ncbi:hypothetical protein BN997_02763 [Oceanobacillus oncorhynchi]|uniref:Uncharacterized protein n=1 Tax=Oceanobacillus oncorhynchi TaxID=545501 RepID=A0A0A1MVL8_9BACI|nr:hypothetical protein [Oceanobacillus oncorhynchi]CEI82876.1 hypothetical protein BN997_02763 [Oceanobacillus oncorhynchi]